MAKYRVWSVINPPNVPEYFMVDSPEEGAEKIKAEMERHATIPYVWGNAFGLEVAENNFEFIEWYNDKGEDINEAFLLDDY
jgi:hypothetical protein